MASNITEFFGYSPKDQSVEAVAVRSRLVCPFLGSTCQKTLKDKTISGVCTIKQITSGPVIICPIRLYSGKYQILRDVANQAFGEGLELLPARDYDTYRQTHPEVSCIIVFGKGWGRELRLPSRPKKDKKAA